MSTGKDQAAGDGDVALSRSLAYFAIQSESLSLEEITALVGVRSIAGSLAASHLVSPCFKIVQYLYNDDEVGFHLDQEWISLLGSMSASIDVDQYND